MSTANEKGEKFAELAAKRGVKASIAKALSLDLPVINNWKKRGVPTAYAHVVASLLGCSPEDISAVGVLPNGSDPQQAPPDPAARRASNPPAIDLVLSALEGMDNHQIVKWLAAGESIKAGEDLRRPRKGHWPAEPTEDWRKATAETEPEFLRILEEEGVTPQGAVRIIQFVDRRKNGTHDPPNGIERRAKS